MNFQIFYIKVEQPQKVHLKRDHQNLYPASAILGIYENIFFLYLALANKIS